jgi:CubicO group peptidase (beta-lactamase class C family)
MISSSFDVEVIERQQNHALGHFQSGEVVPLRFPEIASAGLYSNVRDMGRYVQFHLNGGVVDGQRILREDLMEQFHSIFFPAPGQRAGYGLGLYRK